ncbi:MAG: hypothetical protein A2V87_11705 [Deltaproteobacteria bacterium RBG_16_58_17]|nr:MAG: hypothetical protein A2V87_11705 [Deltaproteobacteria bacterium RBG_16_58_17]OHE18061.1 MAG: hypothetical protein A2X96_09660 [Syntrophobacterales bacterium GWC2_56_13]
MTYAPDHAPLHHITTGGDGAPLGTPIPTEPNIVAASRSYHFCKINILNDNELRFEAVDVDGKVIDQFTINRTPEIIISNVRAGSITSGSALITWTTNLPASSTVEYGLTTTYGNTATGASGVTGHNVSLTGLNSGTIYHYRVTSDNVTSADYTFTTTGTITSYTPTGTAIETGSLLSGSSINLAVNDKKYYGVNSTTSGTRQCDWYGWTIIANPASAARLTIAYDGKYSRTTTQKLYLWNWSTGGWVQIDSRNVGTKDVTIINTLAAPANYISSSGEIRLRVYSSGGNRNYVCYGDFMQFSVETLP